MLSGAEGAFSKKEYSAVNEVEIIINTIAVEPTSEHDGWIECELVDVAGELSWMKILEILTEEQLLTLDERFVGFDSNGGIFGYSSEFAGQTYKIKIPGPKRRWVR